MKRDVFISYIVPCYKIQEYLPRCLDSLSRQFINSDNEVEFVLVNDGSPDNCLGIIQDFAAKDHRAVVINQKNQGVSAARNAGLKVAKGKYVFFLDGDDYLTDDASQVIYDVCNEHNYDVVVTNAFRVKDGNWNVKLDWNVCPKLRPGSFSIEEFVKRTTILPISFKAYRRDLLVEKGIRYDEDLKVGEVFTFFLNVLQNSKIVCYSDKRVMNYVRRDGGAMRKVNVNTDTTILNTLSRMDEYASGPSLDLRGYMSYNAAFDRIIRIFTLNKYARQMAYTSDVGQLLYTLTHDETYRRVLKFILFGSSSIRMKVYAFGELVLPTKIYYNTLRWLMRFFA